MKNFKLSMGLCVCVCALSLLACSGDSSNSASATDENSSSSEIEESSSSQENSKTSSSKKSETSASSEALESSSSSKNQSKSSSSRIFSRSSSSVTFSRNSSSRMQNLSSSSKATPQSSSQKLEQSSSTVNAKNWKEICLDIVNEYRATENLGPLSMASEEKQKCVEKQAADDLASNSAHGHFGNCGEGAQNSGPNVRIVAGKTYDYYAQMYLKMMWEDEKALVTSGKADPNKDSDYSKIGHYLNMKGNYKTVACGFAESSDGKMGWLNIDFFR